MSAPVAACTASVWVTDGTAAAETAGGLADTAATWAGWFTPEELDAFLTEAFA